MNKSLSIALYGSSALLACTPATKKESHPNIVLILADDLGYGDLSCYGQKKFLTPHIDRIAAEGMIFTRHYTGCTVSAPSRSSLMTGMHTGHTPVRGNKGWDPEGNWPLKGSAVTIAEMLKSKGYKTGAFGKWGLGYIDTEGDPNLQGFDEFFGYNCQSLAHNYYPDHLWQNHEKILLPENSGHQTGAYSADLIHRAALSFIDNNSNKPFFLFYATTIPHAELIAKEAYMKMFRKKFTPERSFRGVDEGKDFRLGAYGSQPEAHAAFSAMITELDDYVGELMDKLKEAGVDENTIVLFASDNGPHLEGGADPDYFNSNGGLKGYKRDLYEGGIRTPMIIRWPGKIRSGTRSDHISAFWDLFPTFAEIAGAQINDSIDGISFLPELLGKKQKPHEYLYWEFHEQGGKTAVRMGNMKAVRLNADKSEYNDIELYDLDKDIGEKNNIAVSNPEIVQKMIDIMNCAHIRSEVFPFEYEITEK
jgi:arylsulfatase A